MVVGGPPLRLREGALVPVVGVAPPLGDGGAEIGVGSSWEGVCVCEEVVVCTGSVRRLAMSPYSRVRGGRSAQSSSSRLEHGHLHPGGAGQGAPAPPAVVVAAVVDVVAAPRALLQLCLGVRRLVAASPPS